MIFDVVMILFNMVMLMFNINKKYYWIAGFNVFTIMLFIVHIVLVKSAV